MATSIRPVGKVRTTCYLSTALLASFRIGLCGALLALHVAGAKLEAGEVAILIHNHRTIIQADVQAMYAGQELVGDGHEPPRQRSQTSGSPADHSCNNFLAGGLQLLELLQDLRPIDIRRRLLGMAVEDGDLRTDVLRQVTEDSLHCRGMGHDRGCHIVHHSAHCCEGLLQLLPLLRIAEVDRFKGFLAELDDAIFAGHRKLTERLSHLRRLRSGRRRKLPRGILDEGHKGLCLLPLSDIGHSHCDLCAELTDILREGHEALGDIARQGMLLNGCSMDLFEANLHLDKQSMILLGEHPTENRDLCCGSFPEGSEPFPHHRQLLCNHRRHLRGVGLER
mmetsp:Transcript_20071/g.43769  ORF Transcript_20071/g.43769 Transcript_20071/m.43769 type:complete len:337 (-) Transcript_20071:523-1533(-)